jgi:crossover junction endodeoxyribonuclease RuvC
MMVLGVDPGKTGAIASWDGKNLRIEDVPTIAIGKGKGKTKTEINLPELADIFNIIFAGADHAYVENVGAMRGQGVTSMFNFGATFGMLKMGVAMANIPMTLISPVKWKAEMGLNRDKEKSRFRALQLFPAFSEYFKLKKHDDRAEAAVLAYYGYQMLTVGKVR